jgi:hypothetical protein
MWDNLTLSKLLTRYSMGLISKKELESHVFKFILDNHREFCPYKWSEEEYVDFVCAFYPRLSRAIDNYQEAGSSFDAYIGSLVRWGIREINTRQTDRHISEYACWEAKALDEVAVHEEEDLYNEPEPPFKEVANPRQVLVLLLKSYHYMSQDFLERISPALNIDIEKLRDLIDGLRNLRMKRDQDIRALQERIYTLFYRCRIFEKKLRIVGSDSWQYEKLQERLIRGRKRLQSMRDRLSKMKTAASNKQVAQILESTKGTIDSHVFRLKRNPEDSAGGGGQEVQEV